MIRPATTADLPVIVEMSRLFYGTTHYAQACDMDDETVARLAETLLTDHVLLVAEKNGDVVGMVGLFVAPFLFNAHAVGAYEVVWYVDPAARGGRIAWSLLDAIEPACAAKGATYIQMVHMPNSPPQAAALYQRKGYTHSETSYTKRIDQWQQ